jgi:hypothetical protein
MTLKPFSLRDLILMDIKCDLINCFGSFLSNNNHPNFEKEGTILTIENFQLKNFSAKVNIFLVI